MLRPRLVALITIAATLTPLTQAAAQSLNLRDVPLADQDRAAISFLNAHDVVYGYADGTFHPDANVTRAEIVKIVIEAAGDGHTALAGASANAVLYTDVPATHTLAPYILLAASRGNISGYGDGSFRPDAQVTRAEAAKIVANVLGAPAGSGSPYSDIEGSSLKPFIERLHAVNWYRPAAPLFNPNIPATRREIARMTYRAIVASAASPERMYAEGMTEPEVIAADWTSYSEGPFNFLIPTGWSAVGGPISKEGVEVDVAAISPQDLEQEDAEAAFVMFFMSMDDLRSIPSSTPPDSMSMTMKDIAVDIDGAVRTVKVIEMREAGTRILAWASADGMYVVGYDEAVFPGLGGTFDRFVQYALEGSDAISLDSGTLPPFLGLAE